ncbi:MAG: hypothetical protein JSV35_04830 [Candidatus Bathyarchaeota archaeon]|nr:MAG: hypothetical protein JSV35_04830 [Candidatus Bathyarchaeota archaeon]
MKSRKLLHSLTLLFTLAIGFCVGVANVACEKDGPTGSGTILISNGVLQVAIENETLADGIGTFTISTDTNHPNPGLDVFYDGATMDPWSSFTTIRVEDTLKEYVTALDGQTPSFGYTTESLDDYSPTVTKIDSNTAMVSWVTQEDLLVTLLIDIRGTMVADTMVQVTVTVQNNDVVAHSVAVRHEWDIMIEAEDDSWIRAWIDPSTPQSWTENETDWISPTFQFWETTNNPATPVFSIYGSITLPYVDPPPTPPDRFVYASWGDAFDTAYNFTVSGQYGMDSAVLYYWNAVELNPGTEISRTAYVTTVQAEPEAFIWSTDAVGNGKSSFNVTESVYLKGVGFPADTEVTVYLIPDGADATPANSVANTSITSNSTGGIPVTMAWSQLSTLGEYDIWVDTNQNDMFDAGDFWNSQSVGIYGITVIPELSVITVLPLLAVFLVAALFYKRRTLKVRTH